MLDDYDLMDLGAFGGQFTWFRDRQGSTCLAKKLDRVLADIPWRMAFPEATIENLPRLHSNHCPRHSSLMRSEYGSSWH